MFVGRLRAQSLIEYVTMISIVTMALTVLFPLVKRGIQSVVKTGADQISDQPQEIVAPTRYQPDTMTNVTTDVIHKRVQSPGQIRIQDTETTVTNMVTTTAL